MASKYIPMGVTIPARFSGYCWACQTTYTVGERITKVKPKTWYHEACAARGHNGHATPPATQEPAPMPTEPVTVATVPTIDENQIRRLVAEAIANANANATETIRVVAREELEGAELELPESQIRPIVIDELEKAGVIRHEHEIVLKNAKGVKLAALEGKPHAALQEVLDLAAERQNIMLIGPAGCGKTYLAEQLAKLVESIAEPGKIGLDFSFVSCSSGMSEAQVTTRLIPVAPSPEQVAAHYKKFIELGFDNLTASTLAATCTGAFAEVLSEFVKRYKFGGVMLIDEIDASDPNTLMVINAALSNGFMSLPNCPSMPIVYRHPDFICIAAANTFGTGADRMYVGRNQLDEATLDRFRMGQIEMDYDAEVEATLCPDEELRTTLQTYRARARGAKLRRIVSMRFARDAYRMKKNRGWTMERIEKALFAGWSEDEKNKVKDRY